MSTSDIPDVDAPAPPPTVERSVADLVRAALSGWLGTALEFMDFQLYSLAAALVFSQLFFAGEDAGMAVVLAMATYGVGYLARPLGAWYFGRLGDKIGRKKVLFYTIVMMGAATTLIGVLPTYAQVGMLAPTLLVLLRLLQGFGAGAEISGNPLWLASALQRLHEGTQTIPNATAQANPATAHLYIDNPLSAGGLSGLFSTHPPMEERIARLQAMARDSGASPPSSPSQATSVRHGGSVPQTSRSPWG